MSDLTLLQHFDWAQDPMQQCAGQPIIPVGNFRELAENAVTFKEVTMTADEIEDLFKEQAKRFSACGANNADEFISVLRKNPKTGWTYLTAMITAIK